MTDTTNTRTALLHAFLASYFNAPYTLESLAGDASFRRYHRVTCQDTTYLVMDAPPEKESVASFLAVGDILSPVVNVPAILARDTDNGFLLLQDFGTVEFADLLDDGDNLASYAQALHTLQALQTLSITDPAVNATLPHYSPAKLREEMQLFVDWFLPYVGLNIDDELWHTLTETLISDISRQAQVVVHRDYHSRNLMDDKHSDRLGVIDFQDAVIGAYTYDVVSLLRDAYINVSEDWVTAQLQVAYAILGQDHGSFTDFVYDCNIMGVQRGLKVLGIFVRLAKRDGKKRYLANIPTVLHNLLTQLAYLQNDNDVYQRFYQFLQDNASAIQAKVGG